MWSETLQSRSLYHQIQRDFDLILIIVIAIVQEVMNAKDSISYQAIQKL